MHRRVVLPLWSEPLLYAVVGGFFAQAMFGLYTYITNELDGSYAHSDRLMTWSLVMFNWALVVRVFLFPFMIAYGWEGAWIIKFVLDALIYASVLLVSADLLIALGGPFQFRRALLKK
jgi:predicted MFS family arabinose efflux permease